VVDEIAVFIPIFALSIPIVAIFMTNWRRVKMREMDIIERNGAALNEDAQLKLARIEERLAVLERIATDKRLTLAEEINQLKG